jgi:hypothetical protein
VSTDTLCQWLHQSLDACPLFSYPFDVAALPTDGIYFFYEKGERCSHCTDTSRVVRVGTHRNGNFRSRISEHFLLDERKIAFTEDQQRPHDRSIFRCHIGRALLNKSRDPYLPVWEMDFTTRSVRDASRHLRDIGKEAAVERKVTQVLRDNFCFRFIEIADQAQRLGNQGLERALIGTLAGCRQCGPSDSWLGRHHPKAQIRESGLWLIQHLKAAPLSRVQIDFVTATIETSRLRAIA